MQLVFGSNLIFWGFVCLGGVVWLVGVFVCLFVFSFSQNKGEFLN